jgi:hypothetical protein
VPTVSKKSESMTEMMRASAVATPTTSNASNEKAPRRPRSGAVTHVSGIVAIPVCPHRTPSPQASLITTATRVVARIPISNAPRSRTVTRVAVRPRPTANTRIRSVVRSPLSVTMG